MRKKVPTSLIFQDILHVEILRNKRMATFLVILYIVKLVLLFLRSSSSCYRRQNKCYRREKKNVIAVKSGYLQLFGALVKLAQLALLS